MGSGDPLPMAAPRAAKRLRRSSSPCDIPANRSTSSLPYIELGPVSVPVAHSTSAPAAPLPVLSDDDAGSDSGRDTVPGEASGTPADASGTPDPSASVSTSTPTPTPTLGHGIRGWAPVDDNEVIFYKKDTKSRHSWKVIGSKLHRDPGSCRARWYWLKSSRPELSTPGGDTED